MLWSEIFEGLNPCFRGLSHELVLLGLLCAKHMVLILVFVDFLMNISIEEYGEEIVVCLNTCFRGLSHECNFAI